MTTLKHSWIACRKTMMDSSLSCCLGLILILLKRMKLCVYLKKNDLTNTKVLSIFICRLILLRDLGFSIIIKTKRTSFLSSPLNVVIFITTIIMQIRISVVQVHRIIIKDLGICELHGRIQNNNANMR